MFFFLLNQKRKGFKPKERTDKRKRDKFLIAEPIIADNTDEESEKDFIKHPFWLQQA